MFTAKEKDRCLYCGVDLKKTKHHFKKKLLVSFLRTLWLNISWLKLKKKPYGTAFH